jgi:hypothetical protein
MDERIDRIVKAWRALWPKGLRPDQYEAAVLVIAVALMDTGKKP